jgi:SARP family transcriptional regulator, regulator of embCAB operon
MRSAGADPTTVIIIDGQPVFAQALAIAIEASGVLTCVGTAGDIDEAAGLAQALRPDVAVMDVQLDGSHGIRLLLERHPELRVLVLTGLPINPTLVDQVARSGASGLLPKSSSLGVVVETIPVLGDESFALDRQSVIGLCERAGAGGVRPGRGSPPLTGRERDILSLLVSGVDLQAAAGRLGITVNTARGYVKNLYRKLGVHNQLELLATARERGLLDPEE